MSIRTPKKTAASVATPASGKVEWFVDSTTGKLATKDDTGTVTDYAEGAGIPAGGTTAQVLSKVDGTDYNVAWTDPSGGGGGGLDLPVYDIRTYGALVDGSTDDTVAVQAAIDAAAAAGGGIVYFPPGVTIIAGALQDTSGANSQLVLPAIDYVGTEQITIWLRGANAAPPIVSVIGTTPIPDGHSVIKGTLNSGTNGALIGGCGPGSAGFTNLFLRMTDLTVRLPSNPVLTACNFYRVGAIDIDNVVIDCGNYYVQGLAQPTTVGSYGLRTPSTGNGAYTRLGAVNVIGYYTGYEFLEHAVGQQVAAWGCNRAFLFSAAVNHASHFQRLMAVHCPRGIVGGGAHRVDIDQYNIEHAASGWWSPVYDVDDASNNLRGRCRWHVVLATSGIDSTFLVNGATLFSRQQIDAIDAHWSGLITAPSNKTYMLVLKAPRAGRIADVTTKSGSGTCTATFKINTTALGGTANSVSTTEQTQTHTSANVFAKDDDIQVTVSANSSCADMAFTIRYLPL